MIHYHVPIRSINNTTHLAHIRVVETPEDFAVFQQWVNTNQHHVFGCDTETTGLDVWGEDFKVRTLQLAIGLESWVIPTQFIPNPQWLTKLRLVFHNTPYDYLTILNGLGVELDYSKLHDTRVLAHLIDPRGVSEGGTGLSLEDLTRAYISPNTADTIKHSMTALARELKIKKSVLFRDIPLWNDKYLVYAGMDPILTHMLYQILQPRVQPSARALINTEMLLQHVCCQISQKGFLLDVEYTQQLVEELHNTADGWEAYAYAEYGLESVSSTREVAEILIEEGVELTEKTPSGLWAVTDSILMGLAEQGSMLATAVVEAKRARKWSKTWAETFLDNLGADGRCHPWINSLQARTGRMSITGIPAQTLPSGDWRIRRCFIPDPGESIVSCDYQTQELRVLAALSGDENMQRAFRENLDLHQLTADMSGVERRVGKTVNFAYVYGSGPKNIAKTCGITSQKAKEVIAGFEKAYPKVKQYNQQLQKEAQLKGYITTPSGRILPVDPSRPYSALNYMIQSTSRDITAAALLRLAEAGATPYIRLPIHDEILASVPTGQAETYGQTIADIMATYFMNVHIGTDMDIYGPSWGHGYMPKQENTPEEETNQP